MSMSIQTDSRNGEERNGKGLTNGNGDTHKIGSALPLSDATQLQDQLLAAEKNAHLAAQHVLQLPSPSPTPSPRSTSPSLVVVDSAAEWASTLSSIHRSTFSESFEKILSPKPASSSIDESLETPLPISKTLPTTQLANILEEKPRKSRRSSASKSPLDDKVFKLSASEITELTSAPESLPVTSPSRRTSVSSHPSLAPSALLERRGSLSDASHRGSEDQKKDESKRVPTGAESLRINPHVERRISEEQPSSAPASILNKRPGYSGRAITTPPVPSNRMPSYTKAPAGQVSPKRKPIHPALRPEHLDLNNIRTPASGKPISATDPPSPIPQDMPLPPMSIPTYLHLELSSSKPSPLYIYRSASSEFPYESSRIKFERLLNFLLLPPELEHVLFFGTFACLDALLYTFTIQPLRFFKALAILVGWWGQLLAKEAQFIGGFVWRGAGRMWERRRDRSCSRTDSPSRSRSVSRVRRPAASTNPSYQHSTRTPLATNGISMEQFKAELERKSRQGWTRKHRRTKSQPSTLSPYHKADLLQGLVIICSCIILLKLDASRMYHGIKGQDAIKLYVIYNLLEVFDKLFSALGQDIFECLFSDETLERDPDGRSRILRPLGMFVLGLIYNVIHATSLFCQIITLNVAINSHSNALLTLLLSNQFVEIKSAVFKKFEKDNLFQMTCADVVERFTLWFMLVIIALRNIIEVGAFSVYDREAQFIPSIFSMLSTYSGEAFSPFIMVIGSEMIVDWIKHAYISKFNGIKPAVYSRFLDMLAKDYYANAFVNQNLIKRLGLPVIPLSCLFIRSSVQTYSTYLSAVQGPIPSTATALALEEPTPITTAALEHFDTIIRRALGQSSFPFQMHFPSSLSNLASADDIMAALTMLTFFLVAFLVLLAFKLLLGMLLLTYARNRYRGMKSREAKSYDTGGKRVGGWGIVEVGDSKKRWIYDDDPETLARMKEKERAAKEKLEKGGAGVSFERVSRYEMAAKRIW
ncbi:eukaryotic membrane protein family-domain-containing protein [Bisporella sp. PMI_857]|nr:eukaryotic membrane protein family-domain-containing protein [Bisporella sp. PMI_857]